MRRDSAAVGIAIHCKGGFTSQHQAVRPVKLYARLEGYDRLRTHIAELRRVGPPAAAIATKLNEAGYRTPKMRGDFHPVLIRKLLARRGVANEKPSEGQLAPHEWWLPDLAREVPVSPEKLSAWARRGWVTARKTPAQGLWLVWADGREVKRLRRLAAASRRGQSGYPESLLRPRKPKA